MDIEQIISSARRPETTVPLCLRGDLQAVWEQLDRDFDVADKSITEEVTAGGSPIQAVKIAEQMEAVRQEMLDSTISFVLRGMSRGQWKKVVEDHPPVEGVDDESAEVNEESFVTAMISTCTIDPVMTFDQAARLRDELTDG